MDDEGSGMNKEPVNIFRGNEKGEEPKTPEYMPPTAAEFLEYTQAQHNRRMQVGVAVLFGVIILGLLTPLVIWLSRMAGGW